MNIILQGISGLLQSRKGTFSLIILTVATTLCVLGKLPGAYYAGVIATIASIYNYTQHRCDIAGVEANPSADTTVSITNVRNSIVGSPDAPVAPQ